MENQTTIADRILQYLSYKGITRNALCKANNWDPSKINRQLKGESALSADTIEGFIYTYNDINLSWLLLGSGPMLINESTDDPSTSPPTPYFNHVSDSAHMVKASHVATPEQQTGMTLADAMSVIISQQKVIERQASMLENLLSKR